MNNVIIVGRNTADIEMKVTPSNKKVCTFTIACDDRGNTDFIDCQAWENQAESISKYVKKGHMVAVSGTLKVDSYQDRDGKTRKKAYVRVANCQFIEPKERTNVGTNSYDESDMQIFGKVVHTSDEHNTKVEHTFDPDELPFY